MKVVINHITETTCELHHETDGFIGEIKNVVTLNDIRIQILTNKLSGYFCMFEGHKIEISPRGKITNWVKGFFDLCEEQLDIILGVK
jgi:predicted ATPase